MPVENAWRWSFGLALHLPAKIIPIRPGDIQEFYFIEDIFSISITGRAKFIDTTGALERIEDFTGDIAISFMWFKLNQETGQIITEEGASQTKIFFIYQIKSEQLNQTRKSKIYDCFFCDLSFILFNKQHYSYSWGQDSKPDMIVDDMLTKWVKLFDIKYENSSLYKKAVPFEQTSDKTKLECYYSPFWSIRQNLNYLIPRSRSSEHDVSGYLYYTESDGKEGYKVNYVSLEKLLSDKGSIDVENNFDFYQAQAQQKGAELDECKVSSWKVLGIDNSNKDFMMGSTYFGYDLEKGKSPYQKAFNYEDAIKKTTILGNKTLFEKLPDIPGVSGIDPRKPIKFMLDRQEEELENIWYDDWIKRYCQAQMIEVVTLGSAKRHIGKICKMLVPRNAEWEKGGDEPPMGDPMYQRPHPKYFGKGLIKSITHYFRAAEPCYLQKVVIIKNGYESLDTSKFVAAVKKNVVEQQT